MIGIALGLGGLVTLLALVFKAEEKKDEPKYLEASAPKPYAGGLPASVKDVVIRHQKGQNVPTKTELELAASTATMAGYPLLGDELANQATKAPDGAKKATIAPSPIDGISDEAWTKFVKRMGTGKVSDMSPRGVGIFGMTIRRLVDLGALKDPRKENGVWTADFAVPKETLLSNSKLQYTLFSRSMQGYAKAIMSGDMAKAIGSNIEGQQASLSGLLGVASQAGMLGLGKWIADDPPRKKFQTTITIYNHVNGIF